MFRTSSRLMAAVTSLVIVLQPPGAELTPYKNAWTMTFHPDSGAPTAGQLWEDSTDVVRWKGARAFRRIQVEHIPTPAGERRVSYINIFDPITLAPFMAERRRADGVFIRWEYAAGTVKEIKSSVGWAAPRQPAGTVFDSTVRTFPVTRPFVDFYNGMYALVFAGRTLTVGESARFSALLGDSIVDVSYRVAAAEQVRGQDGRMTSAVRVDIGSPPGSNERYSAWISARPPYVLRLTSPQKNPPGLWSWDER